MTRHLAPVPTDAKPERVAFEKLELPTGGRSDIDGLLRELARLAFPRALVGFGFEHDSRVGPRCYITVATHTGDGPRLGYQRIVRALMVLGVVKAPAAAEPTPAADAATTEEPKDGVESPLPPSPQS